MGTAQWFPCPDGPGPSRYFGCICNMQLLRPQGSCSLNIHVHVHNSQDGCSHTYQEATTCSMQRHLSAVNPNLVHAL